MNGEVHSPKGTIWQRWWFWLGIVILVFAIIGLSSQPPEQTNRTQTTSQKSTQYVFDVPKLIGKNVDQIAEELGQYKVKTSEPNEQQIQTGVKEWEIEFEKDGQELLVTYDINTKKVIDFFIGADDPSGATKDKAHLLEVGNVNENGEGYRVEFVKALKDPSVFTGIKIIPL
jgi:hypothetical protein